MKKARAALARRPSTESRVKIVAQRHAEVLPAFIACDGEGRVIPFQRARRLGALHHAVARVEQQILCGPSTIEASLAIDRAVVDLEAALDAAEAGAKS
jgi:hypothetical protein